MYFILGKNWKKCHLKRTANAIQITKSHAKKGLVDNASRILISSDSVVNFKLMKMRMKTEVTANETMRKKNCLMHILK